MSAGNKLLQCNRQRKNKETNEIIGNKLTAIEEAAAAIRTINYRQYDNAELAALTDVISTNAAALKE